jgi:Spy/CpxP family protein refolding chaperone
MNKKIVFLLVMVLLLGTAAQAQAGKRLRPNTLNSMRFGLYMAENNLFEARFILHLKGEIALTAPQVQKIENMMLAYEENAIRRGSDIKVLELKFASLLKGNRIDRREMEKMAREIGRMKTDLQVGHLNYLLDVRDTLTAAQIQKLEALKQKFRGKIHEKLGRRGAVPPPPPGAMEDPELEDDPPTD